MTTQKELFQQLKSRAGGNNNDGERKQLPEFIKFTGMGSSIQGIVQESFVTKAWDPANKTTQKDKNGDEIPQLNVTMTLTSGGKVKDRETGLERAGEPGETVRQSFQGDLLWKLGAALAELGLDEVLPGMIIASKWDSMYNGTRAREHAVIVKVAE